MRLLWQPRFKRALKKQVKRSPRLLDEVRAVLKQLEQDPFASNLRTHKLEGQLAGYWACSVAYDCRLIFAFTPDPDAQTSKPSLCLIWALTTKFIDGHSQGKSLWQTEF